MRSRGQARAHRRPRARGEPAHPGRHYARDDHRRGDEVLAGEGCIVTAGGVDTHIHFICPQQIEHALASGVTTMLGGGTGPAHGTFATTCTPGKWNLHRMLEAADEYPMNLGFFGKGNCSTPEPLREQILAGACGLKLHEDWGTTPAAIDCCLGVADELDVQVAIHTDTLNESGFLEATLAAFRGRTIHTFHSEGAGGGHAPDIIRVCGEANVLPSSTNPTRPFTVNTIDEHLDMLMVCHHLDSKIPEDVAFAESRIRPETIAAEDRLHDLGAISMMSSDSQAMGRVGEVITRTWQTAHKMKVQFGRLEHSPRSDGETAEEGKWGGEAGNQDKTASDLRFSVAPWLKFPADNFRAMRYVAKYTINPAIAHGLAYEVGSVEPGQTRGPRRLAAGVLRGETRVRAQGADSSRWRTWATQTRASPRRSRRSTGRSSPRTAGRGIRPR